MASTKDIKYYKGVLLVEIHRALVATGTYYSIDEVDQLLKHLADMDGISCSKMSHDEFQEFKEHCKFFGSQIGANVLDQEEK